MSDYILSMPIEDLRKRGIPAPWTFGIGDRVRFYELDALNHVNNTAYLRWFETTRLRWLAAYDISHYRPEDPTLVIRQIVCDYFAPMHLNDDYVVSARCTSFRNTSFCKDYAVWSGGEMKVRGSAVVVMTEEGGTVKRPLPDEVRKVLQDRDGAVDES